MLINLVRFIFPNKVVNFATGLLDRLSRNSIVIKFGNYYEGFKKSLNLGFKTSSFLNERPKIGIVVLVCERPDYLKLCLDSLFNTNLYDWDVTFLLHDDGSQCSITKDLINKPRNCKYKIFRTFSERGNGSWGCAFNKGLRALNKIDDFDIVGSCDSDAFFHPEWLDQTLKVAIWAKQNHKSHVLGPFSSFNSSDQHFHRVLGTYSSPFGRYVVKKRMGALNYFYFKMDLLKLGFFEENPDDETLMTNKFNKLKVRNFCTYTSYIEHIGQESILNLSRHTPVKRAVFGLNLHPDGWPANFNSLNTLGYYKDIKRSVTTGLINGSNLEIDVVIVAHLKDLKTLTICVESVKRNLLHPIKNIYIVSEANDQLLKFCTKNGCIHIDEDTLLPLIRSDFKYITSSGVDRSGWIFQQLLKFSMIDVVASDHYFVIDADTVLVSPQSFERDGKLVLLHSDEYHHPYFLAIERITNIKPNILLSCVAHQMLFCKDWLIMLLLEIETINSSLWWKAILNNLDSNFESGFSEYETYGQWCLNNYADSISREYWFNLSLGRNELTDICKLSKKYGDNHRSVSFHHYLL